MTDILTLTEFKHIAFACFQPLQLTNRHQNLAQSVLGQTPSAGLLHHRRPSVVNVGDPKAMANSVASSATTAPTQQSSF